MTPFRDGVNPHDRTQVSSKSATLALLAVGHFYCGQVKPATTRTGRAGIGGGRVLSVVWLWLVFPKREHHQPRAPEICRLIIIKRKERGYRRRTPPRVSR